MNEFAPQFSSKEKIISALIHLSWSTPLLLFLIHWCLPLLIDYSKTAHCKDYGFITGDQLVWYGLLIGYPMVIAIGVMVFQGKRNLQILKHAQSPLAGEKVKRKVKYVYGFKAKIKAYVFFAVIVFFIGLSIQGYFWANQIIETPTSNPLSVCIPVVK